MDTVLNDLKSYLISKRPLDIADFSLTELGSGEYNHNYLLDLTDRKLVVRVSVSQLSGNRNQLQHEYDVLAYLSGKQIAPAVYFVDMTGFSHPLLIEEYFEGSPITAFDHDTLSEIGSVIARLNNVPINTPHPFEVREIDYGNDIADHQKTYDSLTANEHNQPWFEATSHYISKAHDLLGSKKPSAKPMLIRRDANPNNFIMTDKGMRLVDWEISRVDDPTVTVASFINEVLLYDVLDLKPTADDMAIVKQSFLAQCPIAKFDEILEDRLIIERLGGLVWALERIDNLLKTANGSDDYQQKLVWYKKVADKSLSALASSFNG